ncbi:MAG TPA: hypothetical protein VI935_00845 [Thermodesulfobacteriota bacterium]|nr:hypothetical protein [Thermodesulfobacteriota bacterium]
MIKLKPIALTIIVLVLFSSCAAWKNGSTESKVGPELEVWTSPLGFVPSPPSLVSVRPYCCPSTAIEVTTSMPIRENDYQWINLGLTLPSKRNTKEVVITEFELCYTIESASSGTTYISQTRLSKITTSDSSLVIRDDSTRLASTTPTCHKVSAFDARIDGTINLELKLVFGDTSDKIRIGGIKFTLDSRE